MPLVLSLRKGHDFYVGTHRVVISKIQSATSFQVRVDDGGGQQITDGEFTEILPGVSLQAGVPRNQNSRVVRPIILAPGIKILRGEVYRAQKGACETCGGTGKLSTKVAHASCGGHGCSGCSNGYVVDTFTCPDCNVNEGS